MENLQTNKTNGIDNQKLFDQIVVEPLKRQIEKDIEGSKEYDSLIAKGISKEDIVNELVFKMLKEHYNEKPEENI